MLAPALLVRYRFASRRQTVSQVLDLGAPSLRRGSLRPVLSPRGPAAPALLLDRMGIQALWIGENNDHNFGADDETSSRLCGNRELSVRIYLRCASPPCIRWLLGPSLRDAKGCVRSDLQFLGQHQQRCRHASESGEVQGLRSSLGCRSRFRDCSRQIRIRFRPALEQLGSRNVERLFGERALLRLLDRRAKLTTDLVQPSAGWAGKETWRWLPFVCDGISLAKPYQSLFADTPVQ